MNAVSLWFGLATVALLVFRCAAENDETRHLFEALAIASAAGTVLCSVLDLVVERIG